MSRDRDCVPKLRITGLHSMAGTRPLAGCDLQAASLPELPQGLPDGTGLGGVGAGGDDAGIDRAGDAWFRADAIRHRYFTEDSDPAVARRGLNRYFRDHGLMPERAYRQISRYESTGTDNEGSYLEKFDCE